MFTLKVHNVDTQEYLIFSLLLGPYKPPTTKHKGARCTFLDNDVSRIDINVCACVRQERN